LDVLSAGVEKRKSPAECAGLFEVKRWLRLSD
jgi:hypothetical protein